MCNPIAIVAGGLQAAGSLYSGMAQGAMADYNADVAKINANQARAEGIYKSRLTRDEYDSVAATQRAQAAKSGVAGDSGSFWELAIEQGKRTEQAASMDIWRGKSEANKYDAEAKAQQAAAKSARISGVINAGAGIVGSFASSGFNFGGSSGAGKLTPSGGPTPITPYLLGPSYPTKHAHSGGF